MKLFFETLYSKIPVWAQNTLISLYGLKLNMTRYSGNYPVYYRDVMGQLKFDRAQLDSFIQENLKKIIHEAAHNVPYYREMFKSARINADLICSPQDLKRVPLLNKSKLRENPALFFNERYKKSKYHIIHTTGTTSTPLNVFCNADIRQLNFAYFDRFLASVGINHHGRRATLWGRLVVPSSQTKAPFWRYSVFSKNLLMSSYHLSKTNLPSYIAKLREFHPDYIDAYPSSIYAIAQYANENNISLHDITKGITTSAETLFPEQREAIEKAFGIPVYDQYGCAEMSVFVGQCKAGRYHIHEDYGIVEVLREDGSPAQPGEEGEIVCTGFINPIMPLIRYRIGDMAVLSDMACPCGSPFQVIDKIVGRMDDVIITPDGRRIGRLSPVMKGLPVKEVQYVQHVYNQIEVLIVRDDSFTIETEQAILAELQKRIGIEMQITIRYVDSIVRGPRGKFRNIISCLGKVIA
ncbi:MAG: hypothetical protein A2511_17250 [Deltaproteobacteria bacterium RIFOXYD12_FULL_50_9]|nr:MAG: hypothetical protein A2511_17250 [Deltaproteobacteria bacterium RIFOXYD12_FULL_50_9]